MDRDIGTLQAPGALSRTELVWVVVIVLTVVAILAEAETASAGH